MIDPLDLYRFAERLILQKSSPNQIELRRAVSALYYGLFHTLVAMSSAVFSEAGPTLLTRVGRAYDHRTMFNVCKTLSQSRTGPLPEPYASLLPSGPSRALVEVARTFVQLQEARHNADYDLSAEITHQDAVDLLRLAQSAHQAVETIRGEADTAVFLTALLLGDRWGRRG